MSENRGTRHATLLFCAEGGGLGKGLAREVRNRGCEMAFTENERTNTINALLEEQEKVDSLIGSAKSQVTRMRRKFADDVDHLSDIKKSPSKTIALFWKGEVMSRFNDPTSAKIKSCLEKASASNVNIVSIEGWATATDLQIEQDLWTLWIDQISPGGRSPDKRILLNCFDTFDEGGAWAYYALCEYIDLERR